jgi:ribosome-binding factor A
MEGTRTKKLGKQLQKDLSEIFTHELRATFDNAFITVTQVIVTPDLSIAKVYLSFLLVKNNDEMMDKIEEQNKTIRQKLAIKIKDNIRKIPALHFYYDNTQEVQQQVDELFKNVEIPPISEQE